MKKALFIVLIFASLAFKCGDSGSSGGTNTSGLDCSHQGINANPWNCSQSVLIPWEGPHNVNDHILQTPGGVTIRSVIDIPMEAQLAVDQAAQADIATYKTTFPAWQVVSPAELQLFVIDGDHFSAPDGNDPGASLLTVWYTTGNHNGVPIRDSASSAGNCIGCPGSGYQIYPSAVVAHQASVDPAHPDQQPWSHLRFFREAAFNELQHAIECLRDPNGVCKQFATVGDVHPHFGDDIWATDLPVATTSLRKITRAKAQPCTSAASCKPSGAK